MTSPPYDRLIDCTPIREAVDKWRIQNELTWADVASRLGWTKIRNNGNRTGESTRIKRALGISDYNSHGRYYKTVLMKRETAAVFIRLIGRDPWEFGL